MKIGIFDSGLGGLILARQIMVDLPEYDYLYLGDTARLPYGTRTQQEVQKFTEEGVSYLFKHGCQLVILACNTASAEALRAIQQNYLPKCFPKRRVLGVIIPTCEEVLKFSKIGILATPSTVESGAYAREIASRNSFSKITQQAAPLLVPLIEQNSLDTIEFVLNEYLAPLLEGQVEAIVLGCTHYVILKDTIRKMLPDIKIISQDEFLSSKLRSYLCMHPEIESQLTKKSSRNYHVTKLVVNSMYEIEMNVVSL